MSDSDRAPSLSGSKRAVSPTNADAEEPAQRMRLNSPAAAANPPAAVRPPLSAAQSCAADALTLAFAFIELKELAGAARACKAWYSAAAKEKPRGLNLRLMRADQLADLCDSSSPLKRHISRVGSGFVHFSASIKQLAQLSQLPQLTALEVQLSAADLSRLVDEQGGGAVAALKAAFPPNLRELTIRLFKAHSVKTCQLMLDALPAMKGLEQLTLTSVADVSASLSLEPLLQLPLLTDLTLYIGDLTVPQLHVIKQIPLQSFHSGSRCWTAAELSVLCRPPHRLQQLEEVNLWDTFVGATKMTNLVCLPGLTSLEPARLMADAFAFLPRFPRLQRLVVYRDSEETAAQQAEDNAMLVSALPACPALTDLTLEYRECSESFGDQLMQAVPRLRSLLLQHCSVPSLRFLRHAPNLIELCLFDCDDVRLGHVIGLGSFAPQLEFLHLEDCAGLQLDEAEQRMLTPPGALGLPHLRTFTYIPAETEDS